MYLFCDDLCWKAKNLYNQANYRVRQEFIHNNNWLRYNDLYKQLRYEECFIALSAVQSSQQTLRLLDKNWKSYFAAIKEYKRCPSKFKGCPKLPKYKDLKNGRSTFIFTNQEAKEHDNIINFPKAFGKYTLISKLNGKLQQVRIIPKNSYYVIEVIKDLEFENVKSDNHRYVSIDIGVDNIITMVNNIGSHPIIANGKIAKSLNKYYNKRISQLKSIAKKCNGNDTSEMIRTLWRKRYNKISDMFHKISHYVIEYCLSNNINTIIIGKNDGWKQDSNLGKINNQDFVQIPHARLINMIVYKAEEAGINCILTEESYTSGTSFLDLETPTKEFYDKSRRVKRGLFVTNDGTKINADVNGAFQIMKKVVPNVFTDGIEGLVVTPVKVNIV